MASAPTPAMPDLANEKSVSEERRLELLALARASRIRWVLETLSASDNASTEKNILSVLTKTEPGRNEIPISDSIQSIFNYFTDVIADHEFINIDAMIPIACYDEFEYENEMENEIPSSYDPCLDPYAIFIDKLRRPLAIDIVKQLQLFVLKCKSTPVLTTLAAHPYLGAKSLHAFLVSIATQCRSNSLWSAESPAQFELTKECIEKFVHIKVYALLFATEADDVTHDSLLSRRIQSLGFLSPEHLDIKCLLMHSVRRPPTSHANSSSSGSAGGDDVHWSTLLQGPMCHLAEMERRQCPNDKMACIKRWAAATMALLSDLKSKAEAAQPKARGAGPRTAAPPGADEFLSLLILTLQRCNPTSLFSTQKYLQTYLAPSKLNSEYGYLLAQFVSATHFLEYADASSLTISPEEFQLALDAERQVEGLKSQGQGTDQGKTSEPGQKGVAEVAVQWAGTDEIVLSAEDVAAIEKQTQDRGAVSDLWMRYKTQYL